MQHQDFAIGDDFFLSGGRWRCTDLGRRTVVAIKLESDDDPSWHDGPPYALVETVIDEQDIPECSLEPQQD